jgi:hypothetical protein
MADLVPQWTSCERPPVRDRLAPRFRICGKAAATP